MPKHDKRVLKRAKRIITESAELIKKPSVLLSLAVLSTVRVWHAVQTVFASTSSTNLLALVRSHTRRRLSTGLDSELQSRAETELVSRLEREPIRGMVILPPITLNDAKLAARLRAPHNRPLAPVAAMLNDAKLAARP